MEQQLNILICPLEWGLGHSGRSMVLAGKLLSLGHKVIIGAGREHQAFFRKEMPALGYVDFPGYRPSYSSFLPQYLKILFDLPVIVFHLVREHKRVKRIISENNIDILISDNRFGLWNKAIKTVYITHMPRIPFPSPFRFLEFCGIALHRIIIRKYSYCFIPDLPGKLNLSGKLSHGLSLPANARYVGLLSRFTEMKTESDDNPVAKPHNTVILSGPEPQKTILKNKLSEIFRDKEPVTIFLCGKFGGASEMPAEGNIIWYDHLDSSAMKKVIETSERIIARAGYSTIMELVSLRCSAMLVPTPGQTEQEYLAECLAAKGWFSSLPQKNLKREIRFELVSTFPADQLIEESRLCLERAIGELLEK